MDSHPIAAMVTLKNYFFSYSARAKAGQKGSTEGVRAGAPSPDQAVRPARCRRQQHRLARRHHGSPVADADADQDHISRLSLCPFPDNFLRIRTHICPNMPFFQGGDMARILRT
jgi:hypothetical protein